MPLERAIEEARKRQPAYQQLGELWRYLQGKPRSAEATKPIILAMSAWAETTTDPRSDPAWFFQSLLNLDGRLGPPGKGWKLPGELRPMVFLAAAKAGQQLDRQAEPLMELSLAMEKEKIAVPDTLASTRNRIALGSLRRRLESRYDFALSGPDGVRVNLHSFRGKAVLLNFWAVWCAPCRAEMPMLERLGKEFGADLEILAITDDPSETLKAFLANNPISLRVLMDQPRAAFEHYNVTGIPQSFLIDPDGLIREHFPAVAPEVTLRAAIAASINSKPAASSK